MHPVLEKYIALGFKIFPLKPRGKNPLSSSMTYKHASSELAKIETWLELEPQANWAIQPAASGLVVLDVDPKNGGDKTLERINSHFGPIETLSATTGSGGKHFYFQLPESPALTNTIGFLPGLDLIVDKNHVVAVPSIHPNGNQYQWDAAVTRESIKPIPSWLLDCLGSGSKGKLARSTFEFLKHGAPDGQWNNSIFKAAKDAQEQGYTQQWFEFMAGSITGTLDAKDIQTISSAFRREPKYAARVDLALGLKETIERCTWIRDISDVENNFFVDLSNGTRHEISERVAREVLGKESWNEFKATNGRFAEIGYDPHGRAPLTQHPETGIFQFNEYMPPKWKWDSYFHSQPVASEPVLPELYRQFLEHLTGSHNESQEYVLDWLATSLQERNVTILVAIGEEGIGKGVLGQIMEQLHGRSNYSKVRDSIFKERFNGPLVNKTMVYVDEVDLDTKEAHDRLKDVVNGTIEIEEKGKDARMVKNHASFYLSSNDFDAIRVGPGDRRFSIIQLTDTKLNQTPLIGQVDLLTDSDSVAQLGRYLFGRRVTRDMTTPFRSMRFDEVKEAGLSDWALYFIETWCQVNVGKKVPLHLAQDEIKTAAGLWTPPGRRKFEELARQYPHKFRVLKNGSGRFIQVAGPAHRGN